MVARRVAIVSQGPWITGCWCRPAQVSSRLIPCNTKNNSWRHNCSFPPHIGTARGTRQECEDVIPFPPVIQCGRRSISMSEVTYIFRPFRVDSHYCLFCLCATLTASFFPPLFVRPLLLSLSPSRKAMKAGVASSHPLQPRPFFH